MLSKSDYFKTLVATEQMWNCVEELNEWSSELAKAAKKNLSIATDESISLAETQLDEAIRYSQIRKDLGKSFKILSEMVDDFTEANFDWCQEHLSDDHQKFIGMV